MPKTCVRDLERQLLSQLANPARAMNNLRSGVSPVEASIFLPVGAARRHDPEKSGSEPGEI